MHFNQKILLPLLFVFAVNPLFAQQNTRSPYSLFGVGVMHYDGFADNAAIGRNGVSYRGESNFSFSNPASLSALKFSAFNVSPYIDLGKYKTNTQVQKFSNASFNYIALGVPLKKIKSGLAFGLLPFSDIGYNILNVKDSSGVSVRNEFEGTGGLSKFNLGFGKTLWKYISIGANYSFIFGQINETQRHRYPGNRFMTSYADISTVFLKGSHFDLGLHIHNAPTAKLSQVLGIVAGTGTELKGEINRFAYTYTEVYVGEEFIRDTLINEVGASAKITLPQSLNISYSIGKNEKWQASAKYGKTMWSQYKGLFGDNNGFQNDQNFSLGFFVCQTPHFDASIKSGKAKRYLKSIRYSVGYNHSDGYIIALNKPIVQNGISIGFGFPFTKTSKDAEGNKFKITSRIYLTGEFIQKGTMSNNLIQENLFKLTLGLNLADNWFNKRLLN